MAENCTHDCGSCSKDCAERDFRKAPHELSKIKKVIGIVVIGYGENQGKPHKSKTVDEISHYDGDMPDWFRAGVEATLLAPTAINRQSFSISGKGNQVSMNYKEGAFSGADLGIGKYHFELGAGKDSFEWK